MKKALIILSVIIALSFVPAEKTYVFRMTEEKAQFHWQTLSQMKVVLNQSNLPHQQVVGLIGAIDSLQKDLQAGLRIDSTKTK